MLLLVFSLNAWHALAAVEGDGGSSGSRNSADTGAGAIAMGTAGRGAPHMTRGLRSPLCPRDVTCLAEWDLAWSVADGVSSPILRQAHSMVTAREHFLVVFGGVSAQ